MEEGHVRPLRRPGAERGDPAGRRQGARPDGVPGRVVLGPRGHLRRGRREGPADVPGQAALDRRPAGRWRLRLRRGRRAQEQEGCRQVQGPPRPRRRRGAGAVARRHGVRRSARSSPSPTAASPTRRSARPRCSRRRAASSACRPRWPCRSRSGSTRTASSPTCAPTRPRCRARRSARPGRRCASCTARSTSPTSRASLRQQGQERPGGARGDPAGRRVVPYAGADRAHRRAVPPLRADLDAHRRLADEGCRRPVGLGARRRRGVRRPRRGLLGVGPGDHLPRVPQGLRRGDRGRQALRRRPGPAARPAPRATRSPPPHSTPRATRPSRRPATPRRP